VLKYSRLTQNNLEKIMKRFLSAFIAVSILFAFSGIEINAQKSADEAALVEKARKIHRDVITLDTHVDIDTRNFTETVNYTQELPIQVDLPKMKRGELDVVWLIVYTGQGELTDEGYKRAYANAIDKFDAIHRLTKKIAPDQIELALTSADVRRITKSGKKVAMIGVENAYPLGTRRALYVSVA
jgi:membrane dipeptidase